MEGFKNLILKIGRVDRRWIIFGSCHCCIDPDLYSDWYAYSGDSYDKSCL